MSPRRRSKREIERLLDELEAAEPGVDPGVVFVDVDDDGERHYRVGGEAIGERAAERGTVAVGLDPTVEVVIDPETREIDRAHPIDPATGEPVEAIVLDPETYEFVGIDAADPDAVAREHPALFTFPDEGDSDGQGGDEDAPATE